MRHALLVLCLLTAISSIAAYSGERILGYTNAQTAQALSALLSPNSTPSPPGAVLFTDYRGYAYISRRGTLYIYANGLGPATEGTCDALSAIREALADSVASEKLPRRLLLISPDLSAVEQDCVWPL